MSLKSWIAEKFIQGKLPGFVYRIVGRKIKERLEEETKMSDTPDTKSWYRSRTIWIAIIGVILGAVTPISSAFGHPITVPNWVLEVLGAAGLYTARTSTTDIK